MHTTGNSHTGMRLKHSPPVASGPAGANAQWVAWLAFGWVMMDALINYFIKTFTGMLLPVTAVLPLLLLAIVIAWGWRAILPPASVITSLAAGAVGFLLGPVIVDDIGGYRVVELIGAYSAFAIGYFALRWASGTTTMENTFQIVCGLYVLVCVLALIRVAPGLFPITNSPWAFGNTVVMRPEVMTDQNFQVFYMFPVVLLLALPFRAWRVIAAALITLGGFYVLAKLQTRSGTLVFLATLMMCLFAPVWTPKLGRKKLLFVPVILIAGLAFVVPRLVDDGGLLLARFTQTDYQTGYSRLESFLYLFEHLFNPLWWVPQGYAEFRKLHQTIPHSNVTAMFLEGGLAGLYLWVTVFLLPIIFLLGRFFRRQLDPLATLILIGGTSMLIVQLSLNVPFFKQPWLWAGAVVGTLIRVRSDSTPLISRTDRVALKPLIYTGQQTPERAT